MLPKHQSNYLLGALCSYLLFCTLKEKNNDQTYLHRLCFQSQMLCLLILLPAGFTRWSIMGISLCPISVLTQSYNGLVESYRAGTSPGNKIRSGYRLTEPR